MNMDTDPRLQGIINETRFFTIIEDVIAEGRAPEWFYSIRRATRYEDMAGVDGFAKIYSIRSSECLIVPFQIKSSYEGVIDQLQKDRVFWLDSLRFFIINPHVSDDWVARIFFKELENIRKKNERFCRLLKHVECFERLLIQVEGEKK